jgi:hypothetical protein
MSRRKNLKSPEDGLDRLPLAGRHVIRTLSGDEASEVSEAIIQSRNPPPERVGIKTTEA